MDYTTKEGNSGNLSVFSYNSRKVQVIVINNEPWFVAKDICEVLEIANNRDALSRLDEDEKDVATTDTLGGKQSVSIISEPGFYSLVLTSRKPEAKAFKRWITHEVLPSIRKTGSYSVNQPQGSSELDLIAGLGQGITKLAMELMAQKSEIHQTKVDVLNLRDEHIELAEAVEGMQKVYSHKFEGLSRQVQCVSREAENSFHLRKEADTVIKYWSDSPEEFDKPISEVDTRLKIVRLVRAFSMRYSIGFREVFNYLYREFKYRYHYDVKARCRSNNQTYLRKIEADGQIECFYEMTVTLLILQPQFTPFGLEIQRSGVEIERETN